MKKTGISFSVVMIIILFIISNLHAADVAKIGVVDLQKVLEASSAGKKAMQNIKKEHGEMTKELKKMRNEIEELSKRLEAEAMVMSKEKREEKQREGRIKLNDFKVKEKQFRANLKRQEKKLLSHIHKDVAKLISEMGKKQGYLMIINKFSVLYSPTANDITDQIIKKYNAFYSKGKGEAAKAMK